jgi:hypothetical protein
MVSSFRQFENEIIHTSFEKQWNRWKTFSDTAHAIIYYNRREKELKIKHIYRFSGGTGKIH